ncbi:MAG: hypothetical protein MJZ58_05455 [Paludibacteraceae bacterium]|nr:hypothetical protein [Paludibacteraceae bacterium]
MRIFITQIEVMNTFFYELNWGFVKATQGLLCYVIATFTDTLQTYLQQTADADSCGQLFL